MYIFRSVFYLFIITVLASACSSNTTEEEVAKEPSDPKRDSLLLVYNPAKADKKLDEYFKGLHRKRNFNGNVLVAKKGKIIYENLSRHDKVTGKIFSPPPNWFNTSMLFV